MTSRVAIRPHEESDSVEMCAAARESLLEITPWMPWCRADYSIADAMAWVQTTQECHQTRRMFDFAILNEAGKYAGSCGINRIIWSDGVANIGYWVRTSMTGRGIAPAAVTSLLSWAFENTSLNRLEIVVAVENTRSHRVAEKVGATRDALLRKRTLVGGVATDAVLYSMVRPG